MDPNNQTPAPLTPEPQQPMQPQQQPASPPDFSQAPQPMPPQAPAAPQPMGVQQPPTQQVDSFNQPQATPPQPMPLPQPVMPPQPPAPMQPQQPPQPFTPDPLPMAPAPSSGGLGKMPFIIGGAVLLLIVIALAVFFLVFQSDDSSGSSNSEQPATTTTDESTDPIEEEPEPTSHFISQPCFTFEMPLEVKPDEKAQRCRARALGPLVFEIVLNVDGRNFVGARNTPKAIIDDWMNTKQRSSFTRTLSKKTISLDGMKAIELIVNDSIYKRKDFFIAVDVSKKNYRNNRGAKIPVMIINGVYDDPDQPELKKILPLLKQTWTWK